MTTTRSCNKRIPAQAYVAGAPKSPRAPGKRVAPLHRELAALYEPNALTSRPRVVSQPGAEASSLLPLPITTPSSFHLTEGSPLPNPSFFYPGCPTKHSPSHFFLGSTP